MGLIDCPDCGSAVSDRAPACPKCGGPVVIHRSIKDPSEGFERVDIKESSLNSDDQFRMRETFKNRSTDDLMLIYINRRSREYTLDAYLIIETILAERGIKFPEKFDEEQISTNATPMESRASLNTMNNGSIVAGYFLAFIIPFVGVIFGIVLVAKNRFGHGLAILSLSMTIGAIYWSLMSAFEGI